MLVSKKIGIKRYDWSTSLHEYNAEVYFPDNTTGLLPAVIFIPGNGEVGTDKNKLYTHGPLKFIKEGWKPEFIVIGLQPLQGWMDENQTALLVEAILSDPFFRVNPAKWHGTGLSGGAYAWHRYVQFAPDAKFKAPRSIVPFSITTEPLQGVNGSSSNPYKLVGKDLRYAGIATWGFCGWYDSHFQKMEIYYNKLLKDAGYDTRWTTYKAPVGSAETRAASAHTGWNTYYNPNYRENGMNIYEWMMSKNSVADLPAVFTKINYTDKQLNFSFNQKESDVFVIEKSTDGKNFEELTRVDALEIADVTNYSVKIVSEFYRVVQIDKSGNKVYSEVLDL